MFHKRYQKLSALGWGENRKLVNALNDFRPGLAIEQQKALPPYGLQPDHHARREIEAAVDALKAAYQREPLPIYALKLAEYYMYLERYAEAIEVLDQAIAMAPTDVRLVYALSTIYRDLGRPRPDEAKAMYAPGVLETIPDAMRWRFVASPTIEDACSRLGLTAQDATRLAAEHYSQVLELNVHPSERAAVEESLRIMREDLQARDRAL